MNSTGQIEESAPSGWRYYLQIGIRRRWWLVTSAALFWAGALIASLTMPPRYRSETLVLVGQEVAAAQNVTPDPNDLQQRLQGLAEQTLSRPRLSQLIQKFQLYGNKPGQMVSDDAVKAMRADITVELTKSTNGTDISAFKIGYSGRTASQAKEVTASLAALFIQDSVAGQQRLAEQATSFLEGQLENAREDLEKQDNLLQDFRNKNIGELPEQNASNVETLAELQQRLRSAREALYEAEKQKTYLGSLLGDSAANPSAANDSSGSDEENEQIDKMKADLAKLKGTYTQRYPDVVNLEEQIAKAEQSKRRSESKPDTAQSAHASPDLVRLRATSKVSQLQSEFKANELELTNRKSEINELENQIAQYQARLNATPVRGQQLAEATRNDEQARSRYEALLAKKQQSQMASDLSKTQQGQIFQEIDPPTKPQRPYWPNRLKFCGVGLMFGILIGLVAIVVRETLDPRIYSEEDLSQYASIPVLVTIPPLVTSAQRNRQRRQLGIEIATVSFMAVLVPALTLLAYWKS